MITNSPQPWPNRPVRYCSSYGPVSLLTTLRPLCSKPKVTDRLTSS